MKFPEVGLCFLLALGCGKDGQGQGGNSAVGEQGSKQKISPPTLLWKFEGTGFSSAPAVGENGWVYGVEWGGVGHKPLLAVDSQTGVQKWKKEFGLNFGSPSIGPKGLVHVQVYQYESFLDGKTGKEKDEEFGAYISYSERSSYSSPAVATDGTVYFGTTFGPDSGSVVALKLENGAIVEKWNTSVGSVRSGLAIGRDGTVYTASYGTGFLYALHGGTGEIIWKTQIANTVRWHASPAIGADGTIYIGSNKGKVYAFGAADGAKKWTFTTEGNVFHTPCIASDGTVIIGVDEKIYALNGATGTKKWEFSPGGKVASSCVIGSDQIVYAGFSSARYEGGSKLYGLNEKDGSMAWELKMPQKFFSPGIMAPHVNPLTMGPDGTLYVGFGAYKTSSKGPAKSPWPMAGQNPQNTRRVPDAKAPVFPSLGKKLTWTARVDAKSIDRVYLGKKRAVVKQVFGDPDKEQNGWWGFDGMKITAANGDKYSIVWFGFADDTVQQVRFDK